MEWAGRNDWSTKVIYPQIEVPIEKGSEVKRLPSLGDYIVIQVLFKI